MFSGLGERYICPSPDSTKLLGESREIAEATHLSVSTVGSTRMSSILDGGLPTYWEGRRGRHSVDCSYGPSSGKVMFPKAGKRVSAIQWNQSMQPIESQSWRETKVRQGQSKAMTPKSKPWQYVEDFHVSPCTMKLPMDSISLHSSFIVHKRFLCKKADGFIRKG